MSEEQIDWLSRPYTKEEKKALFDMDPWKSPGPDGVPAGFYQRNREWVQCDVVETVKYALETCHILRELNITHISLIPKSVALILYRCSDQSAPAMLLIK